MRVWIVSAVLVIAGFVGLPTAALAAPTATPAPPRPQPGLSTATAKPSPIPIASPTATPEAATPTVTPTAPPPPPPPTAAPPAARAPAGTGAGAVRGVAFFDANATGDFADGEGGPGLAGLDVTLAAANGVTRVTRTNDDGAFGFDGLAPGAYRVSVAVPTDYIPTTDAGQDVDVVQGAEVADVLFGLISLQAAGLNPQAPDARPERATLEEGSADDEQVIALSSVSSLPIRFAEGRDLMAQVQRRVLGDGLIWLGVPFRSQIDGGDFQFVNCGPASLTMVLAGFGLEVGPSQVRDYLNNLIENFDTDLGTSLDVLSRIGKQAGLTPMDLYSDRGGYRNWSTDAVRWHVQQGHPVVTLVKYRNLPGHSRSLSDWDHYIVISGLTPNGFIYNDAAFATTLGYGLEISDIELEYAWENSSIPHHALAFGLDPDKKALTFPELPRTRRPTIASDATSARSSRRLAEADEAERAPLKLAPTLPKPSPAGPLVTTADRWQSDPDFLPPEPPGLPMGLSLDTSDQSTLEPRPGPGSIVPKLLTLIGLGWLVWTVWSLSARLALRGSIHSQRRGETATR